MKQEGSYINIAPRPRGQAIYEANCSPVSHGGRSVYYAWGLVTCFKAAPKTGQLGQWLWGVGCFYYSAILPCEKKKKKNMWRLENGWPSFFFSRRRGEPSRYWMKMQNTGLTPQNWVWLWHYWLLRDVDLFFFPLKPLFWRCNKCSKKNECPVLHFLTDSWEDIITERFRWTATLRCLWKSIACSLSKCNKHVSPKKKK